MIALGREFTINFKAHADTFSVCYWFSHGHLYTSIPVEGDNVNKYFTHIINSSFKETEILNLLFQL